MRADVRAHEHRVMIMLGLLWLLELMMIRELVLSRKLLLNDGRKMLVQWADTADDDDNIQVVVAVEVVDDARVNVDVDVDVNVDADECVDVRQKEMLAHKAMDAAVLLALLDY